MKTNKKLKKIEDNCFQMGNSAYEKFNETQAFAVLKISVKSYNASMRAIRYQLLFNNTKQTT
jgi:hypothetical protein